MANFIAFMAKKSTFLVPQNILFKYNLLVFKALNSLNCLFCLKIQITENSAFATDCQFLLCPNYYYVFILSTISPYTTGLKALLNQSDCTGTAPTHK